MTGLVRKAMLLSVLGLFVAGAALATVPNPGTSTLPAGVKLVGTAAGVPDPLGNFIVTVRDIGNNLIPNSSVIVDFSACTPDIKIQSTQPFAGLTTDCTTKTVRALTNASGVATFRIVGRSSTGAFSTFLKGTILADGIVLGHVTVAAYDEDGASGVGGNDLAALLGDILAANAAERSDFDFSGGVGANDLALWLQGFFGAGSSTSASPICP